MSNSTIRITICDAQFGGCGRQKMIPRNSQICVDCINRGYFDRGLEEGLKLANSKGPAVTPDAYSNRGPFYGYDAGFFTPVQTAATAPAHTVPANTQKLFAETKEKIAANAKSIAANAKAAAKREDPHRQSVAKVNL
jgi:hypothetical protein